MTDPEATTRILARCLEAYQEDGEVAIEDACRRHPELSERIRASVAALRELLCAANAEVHDEGTPELDWAGGKRLGRFSIGKKIGQGGMGTVYEAYDPALSRKVAIKVFPTPLQQSEQVLKRFRREAEALAQMEHAHIVPILEVGETESAQPYVVMQFIEGSSLRQLLTEVQPAENDPSGGWLRRWVDVPFQGKSSATRTTYWRCIAEWLVDIADALAHVHQQGVVHRDVKPDNILIDSEGKAILIDFGVARVLDGEGLTMSGDMLGTPAFMAPEQVRSPEDVGPRTDVYGLGAVLYQCLTLRQPFRATSQAEILDSICRREPDEPHKVRESIPKDLETICSKAMAKEPASRYASATELRDDLQRFVEYRPITARPLGVFRRSVRWARRNRAAALALVLALMVLVVGPGLYAFYMQSLASQERRAKESLARESAGRAEAQAQSAYRAGRLLAQRGHWSDALSLYAAAEEHHPDPVLLGIARIEAFEGYLDAPAAMRVLDSLRQQEVPARHEAKLLLLEADLDVNRFSKPDEKMELVDRALAAQTLEPGDRLLAEALKANSAATALQLLQRGRQEDPSHRRVNDYYAVLLMASGQLAELGQFSREMRSLYPADPASSLVARFVQELARVDEDRPIWQASEAPAPTEGQLAMLDFVARGARFIRSYDRITRDQLLDTVLGIESKQDARLRQEALALVLEAGRLMKESRSSAGSGDLYLRIHPCLSKSLQSVIRELIRAMASGLFSKPELGQLIASLDEASEKVGDALFAQAAGIACVLDGRMGQAALRFERAAVSPSLMISRRTSELYLVQMHCLLYREARARKGVKSDEQGPGSIQSIAANEARKKALASIRRVSNSGGLDAKEYRFLYEWARDLEALDLALSLASTWSDRAPQDELARRARAAVLRVLQTRAEASGAKATEALRGK